MPDVLLIKIQYGARIKRPVLHKKAFYKIFSPIGFKLKPMESKILDLQINISTDFVTVDFNLLPTLRQFGISVEENNWKTAAGSETIKIRLLNKNYTNTFNIKKSQVLAYFLLPDPHTNKCIRTDYEYNKFFQMKIEHHANFKKPDISYKEHSLIIYSPEDIFLKPRDDIYLDLCFNLDIIGVNKMEEKLKYWLCLLTSLKEKGLWVEDLDWVSNRTKNNTIQLHLFNKSHLYNVKIKKEEAIGHLFILGKTYKDKFEIQDKQLHY